MARDGRGQAAEATTLRLANFEKLLDRVCSGPGGYEKKRRTEMADETGLERARA